MKKVNALFRSVSNNLMIVHQINLDIGVNFA